MRIEEYEYHPIELREGASHYCKFCNVWGSQESLDEACGNCQNTGYIIENPFPNRLVPYLVTYYPNTKTSLDQ